MDEEQCNFSDLFNSYMQKIDHWLPDGIIQVDLELLHKYNLLHFEDKFVNDSSLTRYFHVVQSEDKLVLLNNEFIVWIVPENSEEAMQTLTLIALNKEGEIQPEMAFVTSGVYNHSRLVLRLLEQFLLEIHSTEDFIARLEF